MQVDAAGSPKWREATAFVVLAVLIWPVIAIAFVGSYGLAFWVYFMIAGPPGSR